MSDHEYAVVEAMERYGGSFVKALANAMRYADPINRAKIINTWPEYWNTYEQMVKDTNSQWHKKKP